MEAGMGKVRAEKTIRLKMAEYDKKW